MTPAARARIATWTQSLLDPASDSLVELRDHGLALAGVDPIRISFALAAGSGYVVEAGEAGALEVGRLRIAMAADDLARELRALRRAADDARAEGSHGLWLAAGLLGWDGGALAPLWLMPVELQRAPGGLRLVAATGALPRINQPLVEALAERGHVLGADGDLATLLDAAAALAEAQPGWTLDRAARLVALSFAAHDLRRDLDSLDDAALDRAPIAWLCGDATPPALAPRGRSIDRLSARSEGRSTPQAEGPTFTAPTELDSVTAPLDADASQIAAIAAIGAGESFVLAGPPGSGKSQTIANAIAHCAALGKTALVVSDRTLALDVVHDRLAAIGLGDLCVNLDKAPVPAAALARVTRPAQPPRGPRDPARLGEARTALDDYARALHAVGGFGMSMHAALGRLVELRTAPCAALAEADAPSLDRHTFERRRRAVTELATAAAAVEPVATHPWRAANVDRLNADSDACVTTASAALGEARIAVDELAAALAEVAALVPGLMSRTPEQLVALGELARLAAASARPGAELLTTVRSAKDDLDEKIALLRARGVGTLDVPRDPTAFLAIATRHRALVTEVESTFGDVAPCETLDASALWTQLRRWSHSAAPVRYLALRTARAQVRAAGHLESDAAMVTALEAVIAERACRAALLAASEPARRWFGDLVSADLLAASLGSLETAVTWAGELRRAFDQVTVHGGETAKQAAWRALVAQVAATTGETGTELTAFATLAAATVRWRAALAALAAATGIAESALGSGADHLVQLRDQLELLSPLAPALADWVRYQLARRAAVDASIHAAIAAIDRGEVAAAELAATWERATLLGWADSELARWPALARFDGAAHHARITSFGELERSTLALGRARALAARTAACVLATPAAVAAHLDPVRPPFDVVIFDEASRLPTGAALGALARANAVIVIGDDRQLSPARGPGLYADAIAAGLPVLLLGAHYRSRHEDLFALPATRTYAGRIQVLPAAQRTGERGVSWRDGTSDAAIGEAVRRGRSVAIVALSAEIRGELEAKLEAARVEHVLVATPDRMMGDERDVIVLAAYGPFDALAMPQGESWLNVAVTRARDQLVVVSPHDPAALGDELGDALGDAPAHRELAELLRFARAGGGVGCSAGAAPASPITAAIARALMDRGWTLRHRVGVGPYKLDLAVVDPDDDARFVLAIEHDGEGYASAGSARDRDRLRAQQLAQLGWRTHRIWSFDWWYDSEREIQRAHGAIVAAIAALRQKRVATGPTAAPRFARGTVPARGSRPTAVTAELASGSGPAPLCGSIDNAQTTPMRLARGAIAIAPYVAAAIPAGRRAPDDMFAARHGAELGKVVEQVLAAEAPMHVDLLARRVGAYFGVGRMTPEVSAQVKAAITGRGRLGDEQGVVWRVDQDPATLPGVRVASSAPGTRRDIAEVPLSELAAAARVVVERAGGISSADLVRDAARLLGYGRIDSRVTERVARGVQLAQARELIAIEAGRAHVLS